MCSQLSCSGSVSHFVLVTDPTIVVVLVVIIRVHLRRLAEGIKYLLHCSRHIYRHKITANSQRNISNSNSSQHVRVLSPAGTKRTSDTSWLLIWQYKQGLGKAAGSLEMACNGTELISHA